MIKKFLILIGLVFLLWPTNSKAAAGEYIDSMHSKITVNKDSSLDIQEEINYFFPAPKHGIFRIIPTQAYTMEGTIKSPIKLIGITDASNNPIDIKEKNDSLNHTVAWQIGNADETVTGAQVYKIHYQVQNTIRFNNANFDEFYWNLNGNFWEVPINKYTAEITFPTEVTKDNTEIFVYSGQFGTKDVGLASYSWTNANTLTFQSKPALTAGEGITVSVTFLKNIFTAPPPTFWEKYGAKLQYLFLLIPLLVFLVSLFVWLKFGRDPKVSPTIVPEFGIPEDLSPLEMGVLIKNGGFDNKYISAAIVNLAVNKVLKIEETSKKHYKLILIDKNATGISDPERILLEKLFDGKKEVSITDLENKFYEDIPNIHKSVKDKLKQDGLIAENGWCAVAVYWSLVILFLALTFILGGLNGFLALSLLLSFVILMIFAILMPRRTLAGAKLMKKVEGFKLYMKTAERYRQEFNEKENIFEKFLPYAMVFGIVDLWTKAFAKLYEQIYHKDYFATYHMVVAIGYDEKNIIVQDVGTRNGNHYVYNQKIFYNAWHDWAGSPDNIETGAKSLLILTNSS